MSALNTLPVHEDVGFAIAVDAIGDGVLVATRAQGFVQASSSVAFTYHGGGWNPPATTGQRSIASSNASDSATGSGAQTVQLNYMNSSFQYVSEVITLNGTTPVNTVGTDIFYIESIQVLTVGTGNAGKNNIGTLTLYTGITGALGAIGVVEPNQGQTFWAHHYVCEGQNAYIISMMGGATLTAGYTYLAMTTLSASGAPTLQQGLAVVHLAGNSEEHDFEVPLTIPGPAYVFMVELPVTASALNVAQGGFEYIQDLNE